MRTLVNMQWDLKPGSAGTYCWEAIHAGLLMDIRDELQKLNRLLNCHNFTSIPFKLDDIRNNTAKKRKRRKRVKP